ncbi:anti-sigma factor [Thiobacillus sp.]|uniref:anti-sigma factor family protein n=1 Tax=Thiobacillus sp. TaxID=924 RepID=UPI00286E0B65|nr:anti-sigma factor [Thiobacillus sp.]
MNKSSITEADLQAYVDNRLSDARRGEVEAYLAAHPDDARRLVGYSHINDDLHDHFDPILSEKIPDRLLACFDTKAFDTQAESAPASLRIPFASLRARLRDLTKRGGRALGILVPASPVGGWRPASFALTVAWLSLGVALGWQMQLALPHNDMPPMVRHAAVAYATYASEVAHPVEIQAINEDHLEAWLSKRLGMNLQAPKLETVGFALMGGRLLAGTHGPAAQFMYEDGVGRRLTLYVKTQEMGYDKSRSFEFAQEKEVNAFYWIEDGTGYVLSGNLGRADLLKVAEAAHRQMDSLHEMKVNPKKSASSCPRVVVI